MTIDDTDMEGRMLEVDRKHNPKGVGLRSEIEIDSEEV